MTLRKKIQILENCQCLISNGKQNVTKRKAKTHANPPSTETEHVFLHTKIVTAKCRLQLDGHLNESTVRCWSLNPVILVDKTF